MRKKRADDFFACLFLRQRMGHVLSVIVMLHHAASSHELISIPPQPPSPPLISLGHLEKVERGRKRKSEVSSSAAAVALVC